MRRHRGDPCGDVIIGTMASRPGAGLRRRADGARPPSRARKYGTGASPPMGVREREALLALALDAAGLAVWDWDVASGRVRYAALRAEAAQDPASPVYPAFAEARAEDWRLQCHPDDADLWEPVVRGAVDGTAQVFSTVYRRTREPGEPWIWVEAKGRVVARDRRGRATRVVGTYRQTTEAVEREAGRRQRELDLAQSIRLSSIAEVTSALGHELNQPLAAAMADIQSVQRRLRTTRDGRPKTLALLERALECIERSAAIVRHHRQAVRPPGEGEQRVDLFESAGQICSMFEVDTRRHGIALAVAPPRQPCVVQGNRTQIEQAVANLLRNAVEAVMGADGPPRRVVVTMRRTKTSVQLRVTDTGPGVAGDVQASLFMPYFTTKREGTGLGLSLSRSIAEAHQGRLVLESSRPGRTTFLLELPRAQARQHR